MTDYIILQDVIWILLYTNRYYTYGTIYMICDGGDEAERSIGARDRIGLDVDEIWIL